jgi:hypothetical protein
MKKIFVCSLFVLVLLCPVFAEKTKAASTTELSLPDLSQTFTVTRKEWLKARLDIVSYDIRTATKGTADVSYDVNQSKGVFALIFLYKSYTGNDADLENLKKRVSDDAHYVIDDYEWSKNLPVIVEVQDFRVL